MHKMPLLPALIACLLAVLPALARAQTQAVPVSSGSAAALQSGQGLTEVNKELTNPISSIWSLTIQESTYWIEPGINGVGSRNVVNLQFQPVRRYR